MGTTAAMSGMTALVILVGVLVLAFWYGKEIARVFRPASRMLEAADSHALVYAAKVKNAAIADAAKIDVKAGDVKKAKENIALIDGFEL